MKAKMIFEAAQELRKAADRLEAEARKAAALEVNEIGNILNYLVQIDELKQKIEERRKNEIL
jgi:hypothetical protein